MTSWAKDFAQTSPCTEDILKPMQNKSLCDIFCLFIYLDFTGSCHLNLYTLWKEFNWQAIAFLSVLLRIAGEQTQNRA